MRCFVLAFVIPLITTVLGSISAASLPIPAGLQPGDTFQLAFNSSEATDAFSADIGYYKDFVQDLADAAGVVRQSVALGSVLDQ